MNTLLIVSGMSGAGKSQAVNALEDIGYFCADNVPPALISKFADLPKESQGNIEKVALVVDVRSRDSFSDLLGKLQELKMEGKTHKLLFLDCADDTLETRYKETRRRHPLMNGEVQTTADAVLEERRLLEAVRQSADYLVDTTMLSSNQLKEKIRNTFKEEDSHTMQISCMSFGFKYGLPRDSDLVFDIRCLPNPFYIPGLKEQTGLDREVKDYVLSNHAAEILLEKLCDLLRFLAPLYVQEGKSQLVIAIGCTGGKHRSVVFSEQITAYLKELGLPVSAMHRDIGRNDPR